MSKEIQIDYILEKPVKGRITQSWSVKCRDSEFGYVAWYAPWRRYTFWVAAPIILDAKCMLDIAKFLAERTLEHQQNRPIKQPPLAPRIPL
jgi:hypothetical protein